MVLLRHARYVGGFVLLLICFQGLAASAIERMYSPITIPVSYQTTTPAGLTIMTFNIHHGEGLDGKVNVKRIAELLGHEKADIIALQEVDRYRLRSGFVDQAKELADQLGMEMRFAPSLTYTVGQYGNAILSRYPIEDSSWALLPGSKETRSLLTVKIHVGSEPVRIATTHLGLSQEDRKVQLARMSELLSTNEDPLVVAGDFNMEEQSFPVNMMDTMKLSNIPLRPKMMTTFADGKRIDYLFTNKLDVRSAWTVPTIYSDHYPIITLIPLGSRVRV